jgi:hypothetical protein
MGCLLLVAHAAAPTRCWAQTEAHLGWNAEWRRLDVADLVIAGVLAATALASDLGPSPVRRVGGGEIWFDGPVRNALRLRSAHDRSAARTTSDVLVGTLLLWSPLLDSGLAAGAVDRNSDVVWQTLGIDFMTYAATFFLTELSKNLNGRDRPFVGDCGTERGDDDVACDGADRHRSFFSGHATFAFAGASLVCVHHANLPLYGNDAADAGACIGAMVLAAATGVLRILGDMHHTTDILIGALVGIATGLLLPAALHYGFDWNRDEGRTAPPM